LRVLTGDEPAPASARSARVADGVGARVATGGATGARVAVGAVGARVAVGGATGARVAVGGAVGGAVGATGARVADGVGARATRTPAASAKSRRQSG